MAKTILRVENLVKSYDGKRNILKDINLTINQGEFLVVIGPSGAGKSTFLRCLNLTIEPTSGSIVFNNKRLETLKGKELRDVRCDIAMVFQNYNLINRSNVLQNVLHGALGRYSTLQTLLGNYSEEDKKEAVELLEKVGLGEHIYHKAGDLSGGQMQRVGICRALMQHPSLILADEPIASLDPRTSEVIMTQLKDAVTQRDITCIVNLHQVDFARRYATRIIGIKDGNIVYDGSAEDLSDEIVSDIYAGKEHEMTHQHQVSDGLDV